MTKKRTRISSQKMDKIRFDVKSNKTIKPGPWTNIETTLDIKVEFKKNKPVLNSMSEFIGIYRPIFVDKFEKTFPISFNLVVENIDKLIEQNGLGTVIAACEKNINSRKEKRGLKTFGDFFIMSACRMASYQSTLTCTGKTTNKRIKGFMGSDALGLRVF